MKNRAQREGFSNSLKSGYARFWLLLSLVFVVMPFGFSQQFGKVENSLNLSDFPYSITSFDVSDGLGQNSVQEIVWQPKTGEVVLATGSSFVTYNGYRFKKSNLFVESNNRFFFQEIFPPSKNHPLVTWHMGLERQKILMVQDGNLLREGTVVMGITSYDSYLYTVDISGVLNKLDFNGGAQEYAHTGIPKVSIIKPLNKDTFLLGTDDSLYVYSRSGKLPTRSFFRGYVNFVLDLPNHPDFLLVTRKRIYRCNRSWECADVPLPEPVTNRFTDGTVVGDNVFLTSFSGLYWYDGTKISCYKGKSYFPNDLLRSIYFHEPDGTIFIGTGNSGLLQLNPIRFKNYYKPGEPYSTSIQSLAQRDSNSIWFPGIKGLFEWSAGQIRELEILKDESLYLVQIMGDSFLVGTRNNEFYVGALDKPEKWKQLPFPDYTLYGINQDRLGNIWSLTSHGLFRGRGLHSMKPFMQDQLTADCTSFYETKDGSIWIGGYQQLLQFNQKGEILNRWGPKNGLTKEEVRCFYEDEQGVLWIGTNGSGLFAYHQGQLIALKDKAGYLLGGEVFTLVPDSYGNILMTTNNGLRVVPLGAMQQFLQGTQSYLLSEIYATSDGIYNAEFNGRFSGRYITFDNQSFFFPTLQGLVQFESSPIESVNPNLRLTSVWLDNRQFDTLPVLIPEKTKELVIEFSASQFSRRESLKFQYQLIRNGVSSGWSGLSESNQFRYVFPENGTHTLQIRAIGGSNRVVGKPLELQFKVEVSLYKTRGFLFFVLILLFVVIFSLWDNWFDRHQKKIRREYQLRDTINELQIQAIQAQLNPELIFNSLQFIDALVKKGELEKAENVLVDFSSLLRLILENKNNIFIEVRQEAALFLLFAELESIRMDRRLAYSFSYKEAISQRSIPSMMIFPFLVELAEKMFGARKKHGYINAEVQEQGSGIRLVMECGIRSTWPEQEPSMENLVINSLEMVRKKGNVLLSKYNLSCELATYRYVQKGIAVRKLEITITNQK